MGLFNNDEILLMIGVVSILLVIITILTIFDIIDYLKNKKKNYVEEEINIDKKDEKKVMEEVPKKVENIELLEISDDNNEEILISDIEDNVTDNYVIEEPNEPLIMEEEKVVIEPVVKSENVTLTSDKPQEKKKINIEEEFDKALMVPNEYDAISKFEEEQERTAIISLDELREKSDELYNSNEIVQYDDGDEPITINEVIERFREDNVSVPEVMQDIVEEKPIYTHKEDIPFISSVYGIEKSNNSLEFENTATYEKLSKEKNAEFMAKLREMNENK